MPTWKMAFWIQILIWAAQSNLTREAQTLLSMAARHTVRLPKDWLKGCTILKDSSTVMWPASWARSKWGQRYNIILVIDCYLLWKKTPGSLCPMKSFWLCNHCSSTQLQLLADNLLIWDRLWIDMSVKGNATWMKNEIGRGYQLPTSCDDEGGNAQWI